MWGNGYQGFFFEDSIINIFVTYRCNLRCSYCFARELYDEFPQDMREQEFQRLLRWIRKTGVSTAAFIGGEPTMHAGIVPMIRETVAAGVTVTLFTNGLFSPDLVHNLSMYVSNFVVNFNDPVTYSSAQYKLLHENLARLSESGARITFSKNFSTGNINYAYLLDEAGRYGVRTIRYDISRPASSGTNDYYALNETRQLMDHIVAFVRACESRNIKTGLDCCLKFCELSGEDRAYLERVSMKFKGICHPSIDIHPDLSASYCLPMRHVSVTDVTAFANCEQLMHHFAEAVRPIRFENVSDECHNCHDFRRRCQGGCLAAKQLAPRSRSPNEVNHEQN